MGAAAGSGADAFFFPLPALPWVMKEPPSIKAAPIACSTVNFSCSVITASIMAKGTCSCTTGAVRAHAHQLVGLVVAVAADHEMHDALACQPGESHRWEHHELAQLAEGDRHEGRKVRRSARSAPCLASTLPGTTALRIVTLLSAKVNAPRAA